MVEPDTGYGFGYILIRVPTGALEVLELERQRSTAGYLLTVTLSRREMHTRPIRPLYEIGDLLGCVEEAGMVMGVEIAGQRVGGLKVR